MTMRSKTKQHYIENNGELSVKCLARYAKTTQTIVRKWMKEDKWEDEIDKVKLSDKTQQLLKSGAEQFGVDDREELFCYHYVKTFNATLSALKAGYSSSFAHNKAYMLLKKKEIISFIDYIKEQRNQELFLDSMDIIRQYAKIAFADMTDFVTFGSNGITLKNSNKVDGQLIQKVSEGKNGPSIELVDRMSAFDKLEKYLSTFEVDRTRLELLKAQLEIEKQKLEGDGFDGEIKINIVRATKEDVNGTE